MKKIIVLICILFSLRVNCFSLSFSPSVFSSSLSETNRFSALSFTSHANEDSNEDADSLFAEVLALALIVAAVGYYWLNTVRFFDYPYQEENVSPADGKYIARGTLDGIAFTDPGYNRNRFSADTSLVYLHNLGFGNETRFEGLLFPYFGPFFENLVLGKPFTNGDYSFEEKGLRDNIKLGGQISLIQTNILSASFLIQYTTWRGKGFSDFRKGCNFGLLLRSYPVKPLVLEWKMGSHNYTGDFEVFESDLHFGLMRGPYEFFASWKYLHFYDSENDDYSKDFNGGTIGLRRYFSL
ncbi:MAG: hypothetical protein II821_02385 [Treponema sp.]|nr:hypothetical protein [Treponema sp.]